MGEGIGGADIIDALPITRSLIVCEAKNRATLERYDRKEIRVSFGNSAFLLGWAWPTVIFHSCICCSHNAVYEHIQWLANFRKRKHTVQHMEW